MIMSPLKSIKNPFKIFANKQPSSENARHARKYWRKNHSFFSLSKSTLALSVAFLFLPLMVITLFSFNSAKSANFEGFSLIWYEKLFFESDDLWKALLNSLVIAVDSSLVATLIGSLAAIGIGWYKFFGKSYIQTISFLPMVLPEVIMGVSLLIFFNGINFGLGMKSIFIAHTTFCLPFVYLMVSARIDEFDYSIIEAAHDLGANEFQTLTKVIIPAIMPGVTSGYMMSVTMSLEDYVITSLVNGAGSVTLPIKIYNMMRVGVSPVINSLSFVLILTICAIVLVLRGSLKNFAASR